MPALRQRPRLRRPVREVRLDPLARRADRPPQRRIGFGTRQARDQTLVSAAGSIRTVPSRLDPRIASRVAQQRLRTVQELDRHGFAAACREPRPRLGHTRARGGSRGQGALRVVRCPDRIYIGHEGPYARLAEVLVLGRHEDGALHRQGQYCLPLHSIPVDVEGARRLRAARQRSGKRVSQPRRRQDLDVAQLGRMAARVSRRLPGQGGCAALRIVRQRPRNQG